MSLQYRSFRASTRKHTEVG